ncbi:MAG: cupin domain-containing protein [Planctomycetota bacterium]
MTRTPTITRAGRGVRHDHPGGASSITSLTADQHPEGVAVQFATMPKGSGAPFHRHPTFDEVFIILEGRVEFQADDEVHTLGPGDLIHVPGEIPHAPTCVEGPARLIMLVTPPRFEDFFHRVGDTLNAPSPEALQSLAHEFGIEFLDRPEVRKRHD